MFWDSDWVAETKSLSLEWCPILGDLGSQYYRDRALWMLSGRIHGDTRVWTSGNGLCFTSAPCLVMAAKSKSCVSHSGGHDAIPHTHTHAHTHTHILGVLWGCLGPICLGLRPSGGSAGHLATLGHFLSRLCCPVWSGVWKGGCVFLSVNSGVGWGHFSAPW